MPPSLPCLLLSREGWEWGVGGHRVQSIFSGTQPNKLSYSLFLNIIPPTPSPASVIAVCVCLCVHVRCMCIFKCVCWDKGFSPIMHSSHSFSCRSGLCLFEMSGSSITPLSGQHWPLNRGWSQDGDKRAGERWRLHQLIFTDHPIP